DRAFTEISAAELEPMAPSGLVHATRRDAIRAIHFPESWEARDTAREHLVLSEFFAMQMLIASRRSDASIRVGYAHCGNGALLDKFLKALPFELTSAQSKVITEIRRDLAARQPMNRLFQGERASRVLATASRRRGLFLKHNQARGLRILAVGYHISKNLGQFMR